MINICLWLHVSCVLWNPHLPRDPACMLLTITHYRLVFLSRVIPLADVMLVQEPDTDVRALHSAPALVPDTPLVFYPSYAFAHTIHFSVVK